MKRRYKPPRSGRAAAVPAPDMLVSAGRPFLGSASERDAPTMTGNGDVNHHWIAKLRRKRLKTVTYGKLGVWPAPVTTTFSIGTPPDPLALATASASVEPDCEGLAAAVVTTMTDPLTSVVMIWVVGSSFN